MREMLILAVWCCLAGVARAQMSAATDTLTPDQLAAIQAAGAAEAARMMAPTEVDRVAYTSGWSESVVDGVSVTWRTHLSPYDKAGDEARKAVAVAIVSSNTVDMRALFYEVVTNINDAVTIRTNTAALTFNATYSRTQIQALAAQVQALAAELTDANRTIKRLRKAVAKEAD